MTLYIGGTKVVEVCEGCYENAEGVWHRCRADVTSCVMGNMCPDFVDECGCSRCNIEEEN